VVVQTPEKPKRKSSALHRRRMANQIPEDIQNDPELTKAIEQVGTSWASPSCDGCAAASEY